MNDSPPAVATAPRLAADNALTVICAIACLVLATGDANAVDRCAPLPTGLEAGETLELVWTHTRADGTCEERTAERDAPSHARNDERRNPPADPLRGELPWETPASRERTNDESTPAKPQGLDERDASTRRAIEETIARRQSEDLEKRDADRTRREVATLVTGKDPAHARTEPTPPPEAKDTDETGPERPIEKTEASGPDTPTGTDPARDRATPAGTGATPPTEAKEIKRTETSEPDPAREGAEGAPPPEAKVDVRPAPRIDWQWPEQRVAAHLPHDGANCFEERVERVAGATVRSPRTRPQPREWRAHQGDTVAQTIARWSEPCGYEVVADHKHEWRLRFALDLVGSFDDALEELLGAVGHGGTRPRATIRSNRIIVLESDR